ncbi:hypothetical protein JCM11251_001494 [Rhodosporidiobolus azoricus]
MSAFGMTQQPSTQHPTQQDVESSADLDEEKRSVFSGNTLQNSNAGPSFKSRGVIGVEAIARAARDSKSGKKMLWSIALLIYILTWISAMARSVTASFRVFATSDFQQHSSGLATLSIATSIISSVCLPFLAKASDVFSRPAIYGGCLVAQVVGYIIVMFSPTLAAYVVGNVFTTIGSAGFTLITGILIADLTPLKWRGMAQAAINTPFIVTVWYTSEIVAALSEESKWRWGYGMFAIIFGVVWTPAIILLVWLEKRAVNAGLINISVSRKGVDDTSAAAAEIQPEEKLPLFRRIFRTLDELDTIGLLLQGFGWALLLLPFSLRTTAKGGWKNPSLIAMLAVGSILLLTFPVYERFVAKYPSAPSRIFKNRTFITACVINFFYMISSYMQILYLPSYVYIVTDLNIQHWNYFNNVLNMGLCGGAVFVGLILRYTHRYKGPQIAGIAVRIIGYGLLVDKNGVHDLARLVMSQLLAGIGSAFSSIGSQVGSQASVPHQDVALTIALLTLWSSVGASVGNAIAAQHWGKYMPTNLREFIPVSAANDTEIQQFFLSITTIKAYPYDSPVRQGATLAYEKTMYPLYCAALGLGFIPFIAACCQSNFHLGDSQNAYDLKDTTGRIVEEQGKQGEESQPKTLKAKFLDLFGF